MRDVSQRDAGNAQRSAGGEHHLVVVMLLQGSQVPRGGLGGLVVADELKVAARVTVRAIDSTCGCLWHEPSLEMRKRLQRICSGTGIERPRATVPEQSRALRMRTEPD